jgi:N12 class adenine-specific DNA methylase
MASNKEITNKLNERKIVLAEILEEYNKYYVEIADKLMEKRYAGLGMCLIEESSFSMSYGCYSNLKNVERTKRLVDVFHKKAFIEGHENNRLLSRRSYDDLIYSISRLYSIDVERLMFNMKKFHKSIIKFNTCNFTPVEVKALSRLLLSEQVSLVPKAFSGDYPSLYLILKSFISMIVDYEFSIGLNPQPHADFIL